MSAFRISKHTSYPFMLGTMEKSIKKWLDSVEINMVSWIIYSGY